MTEEEIAEFVVEQIGKHRRRSDIAVDVCEMTGMDYREAQKLVHHVAYEKRRAIAAKQSPIVVFFGMVFILGGIFLLLVTLVPPILAYAAGEIYIPRVSSVYYFILGLALITGGVVGLWQTIRTFFE